MTATAPEYDLLHAVRQRRLRYLGHILRMPESRVVRRALVALAKGGTVYPKGSLFMDCQAMEMDQLVALAQRRGAWNALAKQLHWPNNCTETVDHCTIGPPESETEFIHTNLRHPRTLKRQEPDIILVFFQFLLNYIRMRLMLLVPFVIEVKKSFSNKS